MIGAFARRVTRHWAFLTVALSLSIIVLSLWPAQDLPPVPGADKLHHFVAYGALILPAALRGMKRLWVLAGVFLLGSGLIELIQPMVNRHGEWLDLAANAAGLCFGFLLGRSLRMCAVTRAADHTM